MSSEQSIVSIETLCIRVPLTKIYRGSNYHMTHRSTVICRVHCAGGIVGEAYAGDEDSSLFAIEKIIQTEITPKIIGLDVRGVERCWERSRSVTADILRDRRLGLVACAAVDAAIWDAIGKYHGEPLWRLWGGFTNQLPMISIGGYYDSDISLEKEYEGLCELGIMGMKFKVGGLAPIEDARRVEKMRKIAGDTFILAVDANQAWLPHEAIEFCGLTEELGLLWFEEPCRWHNDRKALRDVRAISRVPICAGQSELSASGCRDLMEQGSIDFCNFDASWSGGPTEWRRVASIAQTYDVRMAHHEEPQIASHLLASVPHGTYVECFHPDRDPIWWNLIANRPSLKEGKLVLTETPGFGWELDLDFLERYRVVQD
jgi:L-alanine-DL-glutamate epimerase-like enolase superfamily enzyme